MTHRLPLPRLVIYVAVVFFVRSLSLNDATWAQSKAPAPGAADLGAHPRIFLRADDLPAWRKRFVDIPQVKSVYASTRKDLMGRRQPHQNPYASSMELQGLALIYLVENRSDEPLRKARQWMDAFSEKTVGDHWSWPLITKAMSVAYDWLYPDLTPAERQRYGQAIVRYAEATLSYADHNAPPPGANWSNQVSDYYNQFYWHHGRVPFAGLALAGEDPFAASADRYLSLGRDWIVNHMLPATSQAGEGGGWFEGLGYNQMTMPPLAELLEAWRTATGEDLFPQSKILPGNSAWVRHSLIPHSGLYAPLDDTRPGAEPGTGVDSIGAIAPLLAARYHDGYAQYFARKLFPSQYAMFNFPFLLWYDPTVPTVDFDKAETSRIFTGLGQVNMRSGWGKDDTLAIFRAGRVYGGHGQVTPGHFLVHRKGNLLVEDGYYGQMGSEAHNTLYIGGEARKLTRGAPQHFLPQLDGTMFDYARITRFAHEDRLYDWIDSDLGQAYTKEQATAVTRRFIVLHPRTVIVIDRIHSPRAVESRFRLHAPSAPLMETDKQRATWSDQQGRLFVQTLLPINAVAQAIQSKESYLYNVSGHQPQTDATFLHVLFAADLNESAPMAHLLRQDGRLGVRITADHVTWAVWFQADSKLSRQVTYQVDASTPVRHLLADLVDGQYLIEGPGAPADKQQIQDGNPLYFETPAGGTFTIKPFSP